MQITGIPNTFIDWSAIPAEPHPGERGMAYWRIWKGGDYRLRMVEYTPGFLADHWCTKGHLIFILEGELIHEGRDGSQVTLRPGTCQVLAEGEPAHRSHTSTGVKMLIVD